MFTLYSKSGLAPRERWCKPRSTRSRPTIESLEGRQLMSLNVFATPSAVETNQITKGPNGNLFFTETAANKIGEITTAGAVTEFTIPTPNSQPTAITAGPDGNLYFTGTTFIGRITTKGVITEFPLPTKDSSPGRSRPGPTAISTSPRPARWPGSAGSPRAG